jgi:hypothetical protein
MFLRDPGVYQGLKAFFLHWAANKGSPDLQFVVIDGNINASDGGNTANQVLVDAAAKLYVLYLKKSGSTVTWFKGTDHATTAQTNGTADLTQQLTTSGQEQMYIYPNGHALANGLTVTENTSATGSTLTLAANKIDGFVIVGAA